MPYAPSTDDSFRALREQRLAAARRRSEILDVTATESRGLTDREYTDIERLEAEIAHCDRTLQAADRDRDWHRQFVPASQPTHLYDGRSYDQEVVIPFDGRPSRSRGSALEMRGAPSAVEQELRALVTNEFGRGGVLTDLAAEQIWRELRDAAQVLRSGARLITMERSEVPIGSVDELPEAVWVGEGQPIPPAEITFLGNYLRPRKCASLVPVSNELLADASASGPLVSDLLRQALALGLDRAVLVGAGSEYEPHGVARRENIQSISMGASGAAFQDLDPLINAISRLDGAGATATAIYMHGRAWRQLLKLREQVDSLKPLIGTAVDGPTVTRRVLGVPVFLVRRLPVDEIHGGSDPTCTTAIVAQADQVVVGRRPVVEIEMDRSRLFDRDMSEIRGIVRADVALPMPKAICAIKGILLSPEDEDA